MPLTEETRHQVRQIHASFIHAVVSTSQNPTLHMDTKGRNLFLAITEGLGGLKIH